MAELTAEQKQVGLALQALLEAIQLARKSGLRASVTFNGVNYRVDVSSEVSIEVRDDNS